MTKVLLVEDEKNLRNNLGEILQLNGFEVCAADNGISAMGMLNASVPDIIISDIYMPQVSGYELYQNLQKDERFKKIPFVFLSARAELDDIRIGMNMGADDYLTKPVKQADLIACVNKRLEKAKIIKELNTTPRGIEQESVADERREECIKTIKLLSKAEKRVLVKLSENKNSYEIADELFVSFKTVQNHRANMIKKLGFTGSNALLSYAISCRIFGLLE